MLLLGHASTNSPNPLQENYTTSPRHTHTPAAIDPLLANSSNSMPVTPRLAEVLLLLHPPLLLLLLGDYSTNELSQLQFTYTALAHVQHAQLRTPAHAEPSPSSNQLAHIP